MSGTSTTLFSPNATTTRGMIVTMLYRLEGEPRISSGSAFDDVDAGMYYADAVAWASQNDIVTGYDEATFGPNNAITREQMAAILYRYAQYKGYDVSVGESTNILSYEDFVRGWRPAGNGQLTLTDGPFMEMVQLALADPDHPHIVLIEEINRGNPAQILGEMLTLLEADKRNPESALTLLYRKEQDERVYLPPNLYVIGTMNIADRSLALVDLALRRRFAFVSLLPRIDDTWQRWVHDTCGMPMEFLEIVRQNMQALNNTIASDRQLGPQFQVGHSYVTPQPNAILPDPAQWFRDVVWTEIFPLLEEYWYDEPSKAEEWALALKEALK